MNIQRRRGVVYRPYIAKNGYFHIAPKFGAITKKLIVHRLVALTFVDGHFPDATVNHKDGNRLNNRVENLEWLSREDNTADIWKSGRIDFRGEKHPSARLSNSQIAAIKSDRERGDRVVEIAHRHKLSVSMVYKVLQGIRRRSG